MCVGELHARGRLPYLWRVVDPSAIATYFDGVRCFTDTYSAYLTHPDIAQPFNQPFFLNFTTGLGMGLNAVDMHGPMPATKVNWVLVWQYG